MTGLFSHRDVRDGTEVSRRSLWSRIRGVLSGAPYDARAARLRSLSEVCVTLDGARAVVEGGWVQGTWFAPDADGRTVARKVRPGDTGRGGACLVGAVVRAAGGASPAAAVVTAGPAIDVLWDAWQESRGITGPGLAGRAAPPEVRAARVRDLTRWNDQRGRTREEVLALIDVATSRAIMAAMEPAPLVKTH
jgi:hypothetical protein